MDVSGPANSWISVGVSLYGRQSPMLTSTYGPVRRYVASSWSMVEAFVDNSRSRTPRARSRWPCISRDSAMLDYAAFSLLPQNLRLLDGVRNGLQDRRRW